MTVKELWGELIEVYPTIKKLIYHSRYNEFDDLSGVEFDKMDPEERYLRNEIRDILDHLDRAADNLEYINKSIKYQGKLHKNENGRYECDGYELSCGCGIEVLTPCMIWDSDKQDEVEGFEWVSSRVEYDQQKQDYYIVGQNIELEGLAARVRR